MFNQQLEIDCDCLMTIDPLLNERQWVPLDAALFPMCRYAGQEAAEASGSTGQQRR